MGLYNDYLHSMHRAVLSSMGEIITIYPPSGGEYTALAIFDREYREVTPDGAHVSTVAPRLFVTSDEVRSDIHRSRVKVGEVFYRIIDKEPDSACGIWLEVQKI